MRDDEAGPRRPRRFAPPSASGLRAQGPAPVNASTRRRQFKRFVRRALQRLPPGFSQYLDNVAILIADEPNPEQRASSEPDSDDLLFGLYEGIPATQRSSSYGFVLPDRITLFRRAFEESCTTEAGMVEEIRRTIIHEVGHHRGFDEDALREI